MIRRMVCTVTAAILLSGCLLEGAAPLNRNDKPYGAHWVKAGVTKEKWLTDWVRCGGASDGNYGYGARKEGQSHKEFFEGYNAHASRITVCMWNLGYTHLQECNVRCF